ncbi:MAG: cyclic GMP-AMP synthase DncV-like nucleotidyltransferase [Aridibacter sp.]
MAKVQKYFEEFHNRICVDYEMSETLREKRRIIIDRLRKHLLDNGRPNFRDMLQGSYKMKTGSKPIADLEYDIDIGLRFPFREDECDALTVHQWVFEAVDGHTEKVEDRGPCIRVTYKDGYHVDLVCYANWEDDFGNEQFRLAHKDDGWRPTDPIGLIEYVKEKRKPFEGTEDNLSQNDQFRRVVRYQRRWIDEKIPIESTAKPTGLAFVLLSAERLMPTSTWIGKPDDLLALRNLSISAGNQFGRIIAHKPTPEHEDMFARLSEEEMNFLKAHYKVMSQALQEAEEEADPVKACKILREVFGSDFPVPEPEDTAKKTSSPAIVTSSSSGSEKEN